MAHHDNFATSDVFSLLKIK